MKPDIRPGRQERVPSLRAATDTSKRQRGQSLVEFALILPIALLLLLAVGDMARLYTTMITIESAVREAADFGASGSNGWAADNESATRAAILERACVASQNLTDFEGDRASCTNPQVITTLLEPDGSVATDGSGCDDPDRFAGPCRVQVDLQYTFDLFVPFALEVGDVRYGLPESITFQRSAIFANSDFVLE